MDQITEWLLSATKGKATIKKQKDFVLFLEKLMSSFAAASIVLTWQLMLPAGASMGTFDLQRCLDRWFVSVCV